MEEQLSENKLYLNKLDQYNRRNNIKIQEIPSSISEDGLENKVITFKYLNIAVQNNDIEGCHRLGKTNLLNAMVRFVNRKFCYESFGEKSQSAKCE